MFAYLVVSKFACGDCSMLGSGWPIRIIMYFADSVLTFIPSVPGLLPYSVVFVAHMPVIAANYCSVRFGWCLRIEYLRPC